MWLSSLVDDLWAFLCQPRAVVLWKIVNSPLIIVIVGAVIAQRLAAQYQKRHTITELRRKSMMDFAGAFVDALVEAGIALRDYPKRRRNNPIAPSPMVPSVESSYSDAFRKLLVMQFAYHFFTDSAKIHDGLTRLTNAFTTATTITSEEMDRILSSKDDQGASLIGRLQDTYTPFAETISCMISDVTPRPWWHVMTFWRHPLWRKLRKRN